MTLRVERLPREPAPADVDVVMALETASFTNPWSRENLLWELANSDVTRAYVLREEASGILAFCLCWVIFDELHINTLAVAPESRRRGLATVLLNESFRDAVEAGARKATLEVRESNTAALELYQGLGFRVAARRPGYYSKPDEDALILWRENLAASP
jgi:[ribosomal protein S18]-alanine N-acetyltransferase